MTNIIDIRDLRQKKENRAKIARLEKNLNELKDINFHVGNSIIALTNYDNYSTVKRILEDLFVLHQDIRRSISNKEELLERLQHE